MTVDGTEKLVGKLNEGEGGVRVDRAGGGEEEEEEQAYFKYNENSQY